MAARPKLKGWSGWRRCFEIRCERLGMLSSFDGNHALGGPVAARAAQSASARTFVADFFRLDPSGPSIQGRARSRSGVKLRRGIFTLSVCVVIAGCHLLRSRSTLRRRWLSRGLHVHGAVFVGTLLAACSSTPASLVGDAGAPVNRGVAPDGGEPVSACVENPQAKPGVRTIVSVVVEPTYAGEPLPFGEPFALPNGGTITVSNLRFFVSDVQALAGGDQLVPVDVVAPDGGPAPYNVQLVNAATASETTFQLAVPVGDYTGMSLLLGLDDACNHLVPSDSKPPLTFQSQLTWPAPFGFLFLRYEGLVTGATGPDAPMSALAVGGLPGYAFAPRVRAPGAFHVTSAAGATVHLRMALDEIFKGASLPLDPGVPPSPIPPPPGTEIEAGDHLLHNAQKVSIFSVTNGP
jgi:hypothetical protein